MLFSDDGEPADELSRLRAECALLRAVVEAAAEFVTVVNSDGTVRRAFRTRFRHVGYEPGEVEGVSLLDLVHPDDRSMVVTDLEALQAPGAVMTRTLRLRHRDGHYLEFECTACNRVEDPDVRGIIVHSQDVSERRELERRLQLAERMESVGRLASGVAHDFNNILAIIQLSATRALLGRGDVGQQLAQIQRATDRASSLTKRILSFARERPQPPTLTNLCRLLRGMDDTLSALLPESVRLDLSTPEEPCHVLADPAELEQVILNLVLNARDAIAHGGRIEVSVSRQPAPNREDGEAKARALLCVRDDGVGMDEATRSLALEPFFTTKSTNSGTGLGLWTVRDFAIRSNGIVTLSSEPGRGTLCELSLPLVDPKGRRRASTPSPPPPPFREATILLAEDEPALRETVAELLRDGGHRVMAASDGEEALSMVDGGRDTVDALVTDLIMPRLGGVELAARLRAQQPDVALVFITGHGETSDLTKRFPKSRLLRKPFAAQLLLDALGHLLSE